MHELIEDLRLSHGIKSEDIHTTSTTATTTHERDAAPKSIANADPSQLRELSQAKNTIKQLERDVSALRVAMHKLTSERDFALVNLHFDMNTLKCTVLNDAKRRLAGGT